MNRRDLLRHWFAYTATGAGALCGCRSLIFEGGDPRLQVSSNAPGDLARLLAAGGAPPPPQRSDLNVPLRPPLPEVPGAGSGAHRHVDMHADRAALRPLTEAERYKMHHFNKDHADDIFASREQRLLLDSTFKKLGCVLNTIGYGHFNLLGFDEAVRLAERGGRGLSAFSAAEKRFMEEMFYFDALEYGFRGRRLIPKLTTAILPREVKKIPYSGHYIYREGSLPIYDRIIKDVGHSLVLTSGVRSVMKQMYLFFNKARAVGGNFSRASRSIAPPAYSYHSAGDFDVGKRGLGNLNFTNKFAATKEYQRLIELGYIDIRYPFENPFGVRFEPWHILGAERRV